MKRNLQFSVLAVTLTGISSYSLAADNAFQLPPISVEANQDGTFKTDKVDANSIRNNNAVDLKTALKDIPGVDVIGRLSGGRQGNDSISIRGLSGNRVAMGIDGIDLPEAQESKFYSASGYAFGRGAFVEPTSLKEISVAKSADSNGLGGSVEMRTLTPDDVLQGQDQGGYQLAHYNSVDKSVMTSGTVALKRGIWQGMVLGTYRKGHATINHGSKGGSGASRTEANPLDYNSRYFLTSHDFTLNAQHSLNFTAEYLNRNQWEDQQRDIKPSSTSDDTKDTQDRTRLSIGHHYEDHSSWVQRVDTQLYWQKSVTNNSHYRVGSAYKRSGGKRDDLVKMQDKVWGLNSNWFSLINMSSATHFINYGLKLNQHNYINDVDLPATQKTYGQIANNKRTNATLIISDDIDTGNWVVSPSLSLHYYRTSPSKEGYAQVGEDLFASVTGQHKFIAAPRLGITWKMKQTFQPYIQYARGFRAPSTQQLNTSFGNPIYKYGLIGNPELKPETSNNFELGFRGNDEVFAYGVSVFDNRYKNFIDYRNVGQAAIKNGYMFLLQFYNADKARIYGSEVYAKWKFTPNWLLSGSLAYARGKIEIASEKVPLNSVAPIKAKIGLAYQQEQWGFNVDVTYVGAKKAKDLSLYDELTDKWQNNYYNPSKKYTLVDLGVYWTPTKNLSLNAGINNLFNRKYWNWTDISNMMPNRTNNSSGEITTANADYYTSPGRNFNIGLQYVF